ncbi:MAG: hypothetical protein ACI9WS_002345 [Paraglaciecola psychrophila]|jgi:hypothetical protein
MPPLHYCNGPVHRFAYVAAKKIEATVASRESSDSCHWSLKWVAGEVTFGTVAF